ncbi:sigma-70 family RNA polymerase sigma factor [Hoylesella saccharolytica]|uniref:RNA polymerase sigma factor n=1 Tax=Hoylesella saccharolytica TaxID=633701 RepID=UPI0028D484A6|nr:sigma-70 family RNA polymerase sigma factor [Hoylesella saccharolytica]
MNKISFQHDVLPLKDKLYRLALRITLNPGDAEDIVQDTLIKVWNRREKWNEIVSIEAFSLTICRNLSLDSIKRNENKNHSLEDVGPERPDSAFNPYEEMLQNDRISLIKTFIDTLPEKQKSCMQLRDFEGKTYKEIAEVMQITEEQVKVNLFRARQTIKQKFKKVDDYGL